MSLQRQFFILLIIVISFSHQLELDDLELNSVFVVFRHGDRTPTSFYPNDPFRNSSFWPEGIGALNAKGIKRLEAAGRLYAQSYSAFLNETKGWPTTAKSSTRERAIKTAEIFMRNFLGKDSIKAKIEPDGPMLITSVTCNQMSKTWLNWFASDNVTSYINSMADFIHDLEVATGAQYFSAAPYTLRELEFLCSTIEIERDEYQLPVPDFARNATLVAAMVDLKRHAFLFDWMLPEIQRFRAGLLFEDIRQQMKALAMSSSRKKNGARFFLYSTHDVNQVLVLQALKLYEKVENWPLSYASGIVFEQYRRKSNSREDLVRIFLREVVERETGFILKDKPLLQKDTDLYNRYKCLVKLGQNEYLCPMDQFIVATEAVAVPSLEQWKRECNTGSSLKIMSYFASSLLVFFTVVLALF